MWHLVSVPHEHAVCMSVTSFQINLHQISKLAGCWGNWGFQYVRGGMWQSGAPIQDMTTAAPSNNMQKTGAR
jgi:hypothetical protein